MPSQEVCGTSSVPLGWFTSSYSSGNGNCVQVAFQDDVTYVRDSKDPHGSVLAFTRDEWDAFVNGARDGEFDRK